MQKLSMHTQCYSNQLPTNYREAEAPQEVHKKTAQMVYNRMNDLACTPGTRLLPGSNVIVCLFPIEFGCVTMLLLGSNPQAGLTEVYSWLAAWLDVYDDVQYVFRHATMQTIASTEALASQASQTMSMLGTCHRKQQNRRRQSRARGGNSDSTP